jgi:CheY-like chemotaxis protein
MDGSSVTGCWTRERDRCHVISYESSRTDLVSLRGRSQICRDSCVVGLDKLSHELIGIAGRTRGLDTLSHELIGIAGRIRRVRGSPTDGCARSPTLECSNLSLVVAWDVQRTHIANLPRGESMTELAGPDERLRTMAKLGGIETILLVDDNEMFRELATEALRGFGYTVIAAADGEDALEAIGRYLAPIHLVVTDVVMPNLDGHDLVRTLRGWYPNIRVLFMSGYAREESGVHDATNESTAFIAKPFHVNQLVTAMRALLDTRTSGEDRSL